MHIQPKLSALDTTMIVISLIIGAGIFRTPSEVALKAGSVELFYGAWILGGIIAVLGALTFAEIGARRPVAGGYYALVSHAYGTDVAFMLNWTVLVVSGVTLASVAVIAVDYVAPLLSDAGMPAVDKRLLSAALIGALYLTNLMGIRSGARLQNLLSGLKVLLILGVACVALLAAGVDPSPAAAPVESPSASPLTLALGAALVPVFFTFGGYQMITNASADVREPQRNIPLGVLLGVGTVFTLYMLINVAYIHTLGLEGVAQSEKVAGDLAGVIFGPWGDRALSILVFLSVVGFLNVAFLHMPRGYLAMAKDGVLPPIFARVNPKTQVQDFSLTFFTASIFLAMLFLGEFGKMLDFVMFIDILAMAILATTLFVLRRRGEGETPAYQVPLYPWLPLLYVGVLFAMTANMAYNDLFVYERYYTVVSVGLLAAGFPLSRLFQAGSRAVSGPEGDAHG